MKKHNGMRPQDIAVLLKITGYGGDAWQGKDLARQLHLSASEISESLNRSVYAGLLSHDKKRVNRASLLEFLEHGLSFVFPQHPGAIVNGLPTAHAHPYMADFFSTEMPYVWPAERGTIRGAAVEPLYQGQVQAALEDEQLYKLLALTDVIRVGRVREKSIALEELKKLMYES